jgi:hypothetical protein
MPLPPWHIFTADLAARLYSCEAIISSCCINIFILIPYIIIEDYVYEFLGFFANFIMKFALNRIFHFNKVYRSYFCFEVLIVFREEQGLSVRGHVHIHVAMHNVKSMLSPVPTHLR